MVKNFLWKLLKKIANLNLSLLILSLILFCCVLGSVIEQDQAYSYYNLNYPRYSFLMIFFGLDHIFYTWWFILLLVLLNLSLVSCTCFTQLPALKNARRWKFIYNTSYTNKSIDFTSNYSIFSHSLANAIYSLIRLDFFVFRRSYSLYSYKGLYGRVSPIFVHISIIAILLGSVYSLIDSFVAQELIPSGETFHIKNTIHSGPISKLPADLLLYVDNFYIDYNDNHSIKQFFSSIFTYSSNTKSSRYSLAFVNKPIRLGSLTVYQTDWKLNALRLAVGQKNLVQKKLALTNFYGSKCWLASYPLNKQDKVFFVVLNLDNTVLLCNSTGSILAKLFIGKKFYLNNIPIVITEIISSTGLQIKSDPGIILVYFGFFVMMVSTSASYISYSQIWISSHFNKLEFFGCTNRAILFFEADITSLRKTYSYYTSYYAQLLHKKKLTLR